MPAVNMGGKPLNPNTPEAKLTSTRFAYYASNILIPSPFFQSMWDGALELAVPIVTALNNMNIPIPIRWPTIEENEAVRKLAEKRDDEKYSSYESAANSDLYPSPDPKRNPVTLAFFAVASATLRQATSVSTNQPPVNQTEPTKPINVIDQANVQSLKAYFNDIEKIRASSESLHNDLEKLQADQDRIMFFIRNLLNRI